MEYQYTDACGRSATSSDSMSLPAVNGSIFTLTGAGRYAEYVFKLPYTFYICNIVNHCASVAWLTTS